MRAETASRLTAAAGGGSVCLANPIGARRCEFLFYMPIPSSLASARRCIARSSRLCGRVGMRLTIATSTQNRFDPVLSEQERMQYHDANLNRAPIAAYADRLLAAEALILIYPVWNEGFPAILKGFFDRVFIPGVSFTVGPDGALSNELAKAAENSLLSAPMAPVARPVSCLGISPSAW